MNLFIFFRSISNLFIKILQQFGFYPFYIFPKHLEGYILQFFIFLEKNTNRGSETSAPVEDGFGEMGGGCTCRAFGRGIQPAILNSASVWHSKEELEVQA